MKTSQVARGALISVLGVTALAAAQGALPAPAGPGASPPSAAAVPAPVPPPAAAPNAAGGGAAKPASVAPGKPAGPKTRLSDMLQQIASENEVAAKSQESIDKTSAETDALLEEFRATRGRIDALGKYNEQLDLLLKEQEQEIASLEQQVAGYAALSRQIGPLLQRMLGNLEDFVRLDVPFQLEERRERLDGLRELMKRADVTETEKFRRLLDVYRSEHEYGRTIDAYLGKLSVGGKELDVDFLRVGRVVLLYLTRDGEQAGRFDVRKRRWEPLPAQALSGLPKLYRIARKQAVQELMRVPVAAPEAAR